ncbi:MAG: hypothetical protein IKH82_04555 [Clostridiales bacterium]|jgi:hypothetical protein|nr:hypothetical protein [Bacteroidales bacterium]MBR3375723.1 hypothetical protein [Bacillota bacterium]MBR6987324.1 hypothetical protein [Clostridiales bacterium]
MDKRSELSKILKDFIPYGKKLVQSLRDLVKILDDLTTCGEMAIQTASAIMECFSEDEAPAAIPEKKSKPAKKEAKAPEPAVKTYSKEDVRALLAAKANESGGQFKAQVKALVKKYANGGSLTDIPEDQYPALVEEVEGLKDA